MLHGIIILRQEGLGSTERVIRRHADLRAALEQLARAFILQDGIQGLGVDERWLGDEPIELFSQILDLVLIDQQFGLEIQIRRISAQQIDRMFQHGYPREFAIQERNAPSLPFVLSSLT